MDDKSKSQNFHTIKGEQMIKKTGKIPNTVFTSTVILPKKTLDNIKQSPDTATDIEYDDFRDFIESHKKELFNKNGKYKISLLTDSGWRTGRTFDGENFEYYDPEIFYNDKDDDIDFVYAVQIIKMQ